jgi:sugar phosphate isomerase/epimerase
MSWKPALHSVSYAGFWGQASLSLEQFLERAHALGYGAVMLMAKRPHLSVLDCGPAERRQVRSQLERLGLRVACLAGYNDFGLGGERPEIPTREMQVLYLRELCRLARDLDCGLVRVFTGYPNARMTPDPLWNACVQGLRESARQAVAFGVTLGVQNHHDTAAHHESLIDLLEEIGEPNCKAIFDAWAPALQGVDLRAAVRQMAPYLVHTTVADYVRRPRFRYDPGLVNYVAEPAAIRAVPVGEGIIDYPAFFAALREVGYSGYVAYEMCSPLRGGGGEENLDRCARTFLNYLATA